jgi:hypothetical protein
MLSSDYSAGESRGSGGIGTASEHRHLRRVRGLSAPFHGLHLFQTDGSAGAGLTMPTIGMSPRLPKDVLADYPVGETLGSSGKP